MEEFKGDERGAMSREEHLMIWVVGTRRSGTTPPGWVLGQDARTNGWGDGGAWNSSRRRGLT